MNVAKSETNNSEEQKLTYEQLNDACADMSQQLQNQNAYIQRLHKQMQQMEYILQSRRMDYLLKVVELGNKSTGTFCFNGDFVTSCIKEIEESLIIPEDEKEASKKN